jgi:two-component system cell cycle response regulator
MSRVTGPSTGDLVPLAERLRIMQGFRLGVGLFVVVLAEVMHLPLLVPSAELLAATAAYLVLMLVSEAAWRLLRGRGLLLFGLMLLTDGLYLAWAAHATGGSGGPLRLVVLLHLITVALLASPRTALKIALWHSLLLFVVHYAQQGGLLTTPRAWDGLSPTAELVVFVSLFWVVAVGTSTLAAVNERELRRRRYDLEALSKMAGQLDGETSVDDVARVLLACVLETFALGRGAVLRIDDEGSCTVLATAGMSEVGSEPHPPAPGSVLTSARGGVRLVTGLDPAQDRWLASVLPQARNLVVVPLRADGRTTGFLLAEHGLRSGSRIERRVVAMVERFASHGALALANVELVERLRRVADTDGLTGIANRRMFDAVLTQELARSARTGRPVSVVLLDLDHFKELNDEHGHQTGDEVLRRVAALLSAGCRSSDTVARYGGEEFVVVLPECGAVEATARADELRRAVVAADLPVPVTISGGAAEYPAHGADGATLVRLADEALYWSKRHGRNRITAHSETEVGREHDERAGLGVRPG